MSWTETKSDLDRALEAFDDAREDLKQVAAAVSHAVSSLAYRRAELAQANVTFDAALAAVAKARATPNGCNGGAS